MQFSIQFLFSINNYKLQNLNMKSYASNARKKNPLHNQLLFKPIFNFLAGNRMQKRRSVSYVLDLEYGMTSTAAFETQTKWKRKRKTIIFTHFVCVHFFNFARRTRAIETISQILSFTCLSLFHVLCKMWNSFSKVLMHHN